MQRNGNLLLTDGERFGVQENVEFTGANKTTCRRITIPMDHGGSSGGHQRSSCDEPVPQANLLRHTPRLRHSERD